MEHYIERVNHHLDKAGWDGRVPSPALLAEARNQGVSPRKFAQWWMRHNK